MKIWIVCFFAALAVAAAQDCSSCKTMKWGSCDGTAPNCQCTLLVNDGAGQRKQSISCDKLVPKCFLMQGEMYRAKRNLSTRSLGDKPHENAFVDNDGIYDPVCESDGKFKAKQCNNTKECWCVNSAGVRRTEKGDENLVCDELVETFWIQLRLKYKPLAAGVATPTKEKLRDAMKAAMKDRYFFNTTLVTDEVKYDSDSRWFALNVKKPMGERTTNLANMAYYMEKDIKLLPLFWDQTILLQPVVDGNTLQMEDILVYYVDEKAPTFVMKNLSGGIIAVIVVVVLVVVAGLLFLVFYTRRQRYTKAKQNDTSS